MKILVLIESVNINMHSGAICGSNTIGALRSGGNEIDALYPDLYANPDPVWMAGVRSVRFDLEKASPYERSINFFPKLRALPALFSGFNPERMRLIRSWQKAIARQLENGSYDLIVILGVGSVFAAHFAMAQIETDVPWVAHIHDPYPMSHYPPPYAKPDTLLQRRQAKAFDDLMRKAPHVSFPSLRLLEWMRQYHPHLEKKAFVMPHPAPAWEELPGGEDDASVRLDAHKFNLLHAGSLLGPRDPKSLIRAFLRFIEEDPERKARSVLNIIGKMAKEHAGFENAYREVEANLNIVSVRVSYRHSLELLRQADVLILLEAAVKDSPFMPGKLADYISADRAILALTPEHSETARLLGATYPYAAASDDEERIHALIVALWGQWKAGTLQRSEKPELAAYVSPENVNRLMMAAIGEREGVPS